jgi:hypothetical protein
MVLSSHKLARSLPSHTMYGPEKRQFQHDPERPDSFDKGDDNLPRAPRYMSKVWILLTLDSGMNCIQATVLLLYSQRDEGSRLHHYPF